MSAVFITAMGAYASGSGININAVTAGDDGWVYLTGYSMSNISNPPSLIALGYKNGELIWTQNFNGSVPGAFNALTFKDGSIYVAGTIGAGFNGENLAVDGVPLEGPNDKPEIDPALQALWPSHYSYITYPIYVKLNAESGELELAKVLSSPNVQATDSLSSIEVDATGQVYVAGGGWNPGSDRTASYGGNDAEFFWNTRKFSINGDELWSVDGETVTINPFTNMPFLSTYQDRLIQLDPMDGGTSQEINTGLTYIYQEVSNWVRKIIFDGDGNAYVLAVRSLWDNALNDYSDLHGVIVKVNLDSQQVLWRTQFGEDADECMPNSVTFASDGSLLISGLSKGSVEGIKGLGGTDGFLMAINPDDGSIESTEIIGSTKNESISQVMFQPTLGLNEDNMIIAGSFDVGVYSLEGRDQKDMYLITTRGFTLIGNALDNTIHGGDGNDSISAGLGEDSLFGGKGNDTLNGGDGNDTADYSQIDSGVKIDLGARKVTGLTSASKLLVGTDKVSNIENAVGGSGNDTLVANSKGSELSGGGGNDTLKGGGKSDTLYGGDGNDLISAGGGNDIIVGGDGAGDDTYDGGAGIDTMRYSSATDAITVNLMLTSANVTSTHGNDLSGIGTDKLTNIENIIAGNYDDTLIGNKLNNQLEGGNGNDTVNGGLGNDNLIGGDGEDTFSFNTKLNKSSNVDTITDFNHTDDVIQLALSIFINIKGSDNTFNASDIDVNTWTGKQKVNATNDAHLIFNTSSHALYYDADANGKGIAIQFATLTGIDTVSASDFVIF
jgi:Ca2+-binding RTX toxin-like protein